MIERATVALADLHPSWRPGGGQLVLTFECPGHLDGRTGCPRIEIPSRDGTYNTGWYLTGSIRDYDLTISPSIKTSCGFHGWVRLGRVSFCVDAT